MSSQFLRKALVTALLMLLGASILATSTVLAPPGFVVTVYTNKSVYGLEEVEIYGNLTLDSNPVQGGLVGVEVRDPDSPPKIIVARTLPVGTITPPYSGWPVEVISASLCTAQGRSLQSVVRGNEAYFNATVRNNSPVSQEIVLTINVYDNGIIPIDTLSFEYVAASGDVTTLRGSMYIPTWANTGVSPIYANAYTDWPHAGGVPYCPEKAGNYTLKKSAGDNPSGNPLPTPFIQNGTYKMNFTLSPDSVLGTYSVNASAWYQGWTDTHANTFAVPLIHDPAILNLQPLDAIYDKWVVKIPVTVKNEGTVNQTFSVKLYYNTTNLIQTQQVTNLGPGLSTTLNFTWNTTSIVRYAHYNLTATIPPVVNETDTSDNARSKLIHTMALGDQNNNREIDIFDLTKITICYGATPTSPKWNIMSDLKPDSKIDIYDLTKLTAIFGKKY